VAMFVRLQAPLAKTGHLPPGHRHEPNVPATELEMAPTAKLP